MPSDPLTKAPPMRAYPAEPDPRLGAPIGGYGAVLNNHVGVSALVRCSIEDEANAAARRLAAGCNLLKALKRIGSPVLVDNALLVGADAARHDAHNPESANIVRSIADAIREALEASGE